MTPGDDDHDLGIGAIERNSGASSADPAGAVEAADGVVDASAVEASAAVDAPDAALGLDEISAGLAAGTLTPAEAQATLIDRIVAAQLPAGAEPAIVDAVRTEVAAALAEDPVLASLLDPRG